MVETRAKHARRHHGVTALSAGAVVVDELEVPRGFGEPDRCAFQMVVEMVQ